MPAPMSKRRGDCLPLLLVLVVLIFLSEYGGDTHGMRVRREPDATYDSQVSDVEAFVRKQSQVHTPPKIPATTASTPARALGGDTRPQQRQQQQQQQQRVDNRQQRRRNFKPQTVSLVERGVVASNVTHMKQVTFQLSGGTPNCDNCTTGYNYGSFACSDDKSNWKSGEMTFQDPMPVSSVLVQVNVTSYGRYNCLNTTVANNLLFVLQSEYIYFGTLPDQPAGCDCGNCGTPVQFNSSYYAHGWPSYNYGGDNMLQATPASGNVICLSRIELTMFYTIPEPTVTFIFPNAGLVELPTPIDVYGTNFVNTGRLSCVFGNIPSSASFITSTHLNCTSPTVLTPGTVNFSITEDGERVSPTQGTNFTYYPVPIVTGVTPPEGPLTGGTSVVVTGDGFFESRFLYCRFGNLNPTLASYVSSTTVTCSSPATQYSSETSVAVEVSEDGNQWSRNQVQFEYKPSSKPSSESMGSTTGGPLPIYVWVLFGVAALTFVLFAIIVLLLVRMRVRNLRRKRLMRSAGINGDPDAFSRLIGSGSGKNGRSTGSIRWTDLKEMVKIEKGSFGEIYKCKWRGTTVALKKVPSIHMTEAVVDELQREAALMSTLRHPNVLQFLGTCFDPKGDDICIVMEYMERGSLYRIIHSPLIALPIARIKMICLAAAKGMDYLHNHNPPIIHRDLKSHNLLVDQHWTVKVCDFGLSTILERANQALTACGTPSWTAPEVLRNEIYSAKADVYSFGVLVWELFARKDPFPDMPPFQVVFAVGHQGRRPQMPKDLPNEWDSLIRDCWAEDPDSRPSFHDIVLYLQKTK
eukprot:TRINITY_DN944_c0_g1_i1.p1 TRINITY_DN944_c0_g1~~TRINITY_DN944_c0_g1_i1.p1  ORF type:complete len:806 (+),score=134.52 TRINITY_DN944_c0_g1_i1:321-2738(+)